MAQALQIDTLAFSKKLREAGADEGLADAIVEGLTAADTSDLATKADVASVESALKADIVSVESRLKTEIAETRAEISNAENRLKAEISETRVEISNVENRLKTEISQTRAEIAEVKTDLSWIKLIGGAIVALLILPWFAELAKIALN